MRGLGCFSGAALLAAVCMAAPAWGQAQSAVQVLEEVEAELSAMNRILDGVKDKESADAAAPELEAVKARLARLEVSQSLDGEKVPVPDKKDIPAMERRIAAIRALHESMMGKVAALDKEKYYDSQALYVLLQLLAPAKPLPEPEAAPVGE